MAGPQFNLPSPNDNDGCFPLGMGSGFRGTTGLRCLVRQVPHLAHKRPGVESGSSSSRSLSSIPDDSHVIVRTDNMAVVSRINRQEGSRSRTLNRHARQLLVWAQDKFFCPTGLEPSGGLLVKTEAQVREMDAEPSYGGSDLGKIRHGRGGPLCVTGVVPMPPLVLPLSPYLSGDRCASAPLARHEAVCFPAGQAHSSSAEDMRTLPSSSPVLAFPDVVLRVNLPPGGQPMGDSGQEGPLAPMSRDLEVVGMADHRYTEFSPCLVKAFLRPRPGYVPKVLSMPFRSQVIVLQAFSHSPSSEGDDLRLLCPVRAPKMYVDRSNQWRQSLQCVLAQAAKG